MKTILFLDNKEELIDEMYIYQIYFNLYKQSTSEKEILLFNIIERDKNKYIFTKKRLKRDQDNDNIITERDIVNTNDDDNIESIIDNYLNDLSEEYEVYLLVTNLGQSKLLSKHIDSIITIKKGELVVPI